MTLFLLTGKWHQSIDYFSYRASSTPLRENDTISALSSTRFLFLVGWWRNDGGKEARRRGFALRRTVGLWWRHPHNAIDQIVATWGDEHGQLLLSHHLRSAGRPVGSCDVCTITKRVAFVFVTVGLCVEMKVHFCLLELFFYNNHLKPLLFNHGEILADINESEKCLYFFDSILANRHFRIYNLREDIFALLAIFAKIAKIGTR